MLVKNASYSSATAINNAGVVVGTYPVSFSPWQDSVQEGFVSNNGVFTTIADHKPFPLTIIPSNISSNGNVAGNEQDPNYLNVTSAWAIINGKFTKLGGLHDFSDGRIHSSVNDINRSGWAVGAAELSNGMSHATLYENGSVFDLNSLVDPSLNVTLTAAGGINDKGQIVATACTGVWNGCSVVLLNPLAAPPVPEPETYAMLLGGLGVVGVAVRRRRRYAKG
nr:PEPxxWA-CTERM sorting domain-containing protein [Duganella violaceicalia]